MGIIKNTLQNQINNNSRQQFNDTTARVLDFDILTNTATIKYMNPNGEGCYIQGNVPIAETLGGVTGAGISIGCECTISFLSNNVYCPIITGTLESQYKYKTNSDQGAYIIDESILQTTKPNVGQGMIHDWQEQGMIITNKYVNDICDFKNTDVSAETHKIISQLDKYSQNEQGITNLATKANVKLKENGDIDLFVSNNVGIRISKEKHKIYFYGLGLYLNDKEIKNYEYLCYNDSEMNDNTNNNNTANIDFERLLESLKDDVEELKKIIHYLKQTTGEELRYKNLENKISEYEEIYDNYYNGKTKDTDIRWMTQTLEPMKKLFTQELQEAQNILNPIMK